MEDNPSWLIAFGLYLFGRDEVVVDLLGDQRAQPIALVVLFPALVLVVVGQYANGHDAGARVNKSRIGARFVHGAILVRDHDVFGQEAFELILVFVFGQVIEHGLFVERPAAVAALDLLEKLDHLAGRRRAEAVAFGAFGRDGSRGAPLRLLRPAAV